MKLYRASCVNFNHLSERSLTKYESCANAIRNPPLCANGRKGEKALCANEVQIDVTRRLLWTPADACRILRYNVYHLIDLCKLNLIIDEMKNDVGLSFYI